MERRTSDQHLLSHPGASLGAHRSVSDGRVPDAVGAMATPQAQAKVALVCSGPSSRVGRFDPDPPTQISECPRRAAWARPERSIAEAAWDSTQVMAGCIGGPRPCGRDRHGSVADWPTGEPYRCLTFHGSDMNVWPDAHPERAAEFRTVVQGAQAVIGVSAALVERIREVTGPRPSTCRSASITGGWQRSPCPGTRHDERSDCREDRLIALFVGNLKRSKGVAEFVDAILRLGEPYLGVLVGGGPRRATADGPSRSGAARVPRRLSRTRTSCDTCPLRTSLCSRHMGRAFRRYWSRPARLGYRSSRPRSAVSPSSLVTIEGRFCKTSQPRALASPSNSSSVQRTKRCLLPIGCDGTSSSSTTSTAMRRVSLATIGPLRRVLARGPERRDRPMPGTLVPVGITIASQGQTPSGPHPIDVPTTPKLPGRSWLRRRSRPCKGSSHPGAHRHGQDSGTGHRHAIPAGPRSTPVARRGRKATGPPGPAGLPEGVPIGCIGTRTTGSTRPPRRSPPSPLSGPDLCVGGRSASSHSCCWPSSGRPSRSSPGPRRVAW